MLKALHLVTLIIVSSFCCFSQSTLSGTRNSWTWPFSKFSIWNMPIGSDAHNEDANFEPAGHVGVDIQHILELSSTDPEKTVLSTDVWGPGRCDGTKNLGFTLRVPNNWIVPDAGNSPYGNTPNSNFALRLPNSDEVFEGSQITRCTKGGAVHLPSWMQYSNNRNYQSIYGDGLEGGGQGASAMSALGGTIRLGEFESSEPIRHAIKINPWAEKYCFYVDTLPGFKWPAFNADSYAKNTYKGSNPNVVMGSLFAIPDTITPEEIGIESVPGKKLFFTLQNYGSYFTEDAAWDTWDIIVERGAEIEFENLYGFSMSSVTWENELNKLMQALAVVVNNSPTSIGGGGTPHQPYAPEFSDVVTSTAVFEQSESISIGYPNPTNSIVHFSKKIKYKLYNSVGQLLEEGNSQMLNLIDYPNRLYFLHSNDKMYKIIKE